MVSVSAGLVGSRSIPFFFGATVLAFVIASIARGNLSQGFASTSAIPAYLWIFILYGMVSATWAADTQLAMYKTSLVLVIALGTLIIVNLLAHESRGDLLHMGEGLWIGLTIGLVYFLIEELTDSAIKIALINAAGLGPHDVSPLRNYEWKNGSLVAIWQGSLARNATPITPILWPTVMAVQGTLSGSRRMFAVGAIVSLAAAVVFLSMHETSMVAFVVGLVAFALARAWPRLTGHLIATAWIIACLVVVPSAMLAHRFDLHNATWLQDSARHRIIIWNFTATQTLKSPIFGVGATSTYVIGPKLSKEVPQLPDEAFERTLSRHAHNLYLQTWYELGLLGAVLFALAGLSIIQQIRRLAANLQPYAYATFASSAAVAASSYGMWQTWFVAVFGFCAALFALGRQLIERNGETDHAP